MSEVKRYAKRLTRSQIEHAQPRTEFVTATDYEALKADRDQARITAEYWKAEHLAGNQSLDAALTECERLRVLLGELREVTGEYAWDGGICERIDAALSAKP